MNKRKREGSIAGQDLEGRTVLLTERVAFEDNYRSRVFRPDGGFGCSPHTSGTAVFGEFAHLRSDKSTNPIRMRVERYDVERMLPAVLLRWQSGMNVARVYTEEGETGYVIDRDKTGKRWVYFEPGGTKPSTRTFTTLESIADYMFEMVSER